MPEGGPQEMIKSLQRQNTPKEETSNGLSPKASRVVKFQAMTMKSKTKNRPLQSIQEEYARENKEFRKSKSGESELSQTISD